MVIGCVHILISILSILMCSFLITYFGFYFGLYGTNIWIEYFNNPFMLISLLTLVILSLKVWIILYFIKKKELVLGFERVKDLVRGTIVTKSVDELFDAYYCFKHIPNLEIIEIKDILTLHEPLEFNFCDGDTTLISPKNSCGRFLGREGAGDQGAGGARASRPDSGAVTLFFWHTLF